MEWVWAMAPMVLVIAQPVSAAVVVTSGQCSQAGGCSSLAGFDATLGTLQSVTFSNSPGGVAERTTYTFTNTTSSFQNPTYTFKSTVIASLNGVSFGSYSLTDRIAPGFTPNQTRNVVVGLAPGFNYTITSDLDRFIGSSGFTPDFSGSTSVITNPTASSNVAVSVNSSVPGYLSGVYSVQYTYEAPTAAVPEPATWSMMLFGFGAIGVMMRRRSNSVTRTPRLI